MSDKKQNNQKNSDNKNHKLEEKFTWVDKVVDVLEKRKDKVYKVHGMWTPSGFFHIGNSRVELMIPSFVTAALKKRGLKAEQNFIIDDFDDFDKVPKGLDIDAKEFEQYLGKPLITVPSPVEGFDSWAAYFKNEVVSALEDFGIKPNIISSYESYATGLFNDAIKIALDKRDKIKEIWEEVSGAKKPKDWMPVMVICENCGRSATTKPISWDGTHIEYLCTKNVNYTTGCRHKGKVKPENGAVKLHWRVHWAANWYVHGTSFETAGKDHHSAGGSVETSQRFIKEIFGKEGPYQPPSEFLLIDNAKLSGSVGNTISLKDWLTFAEPELLRFLMCSYQPHTVINFDLHSNKFFLLSDRYEEAERVFYKTETKGEKRDHQLTNYFELSQTSEDVPTKQPVQLQYNIAQMVVQTFPNKSIEELVGILASRGWIAKTRISKTEKERIEKRLSLAKTWLEVYAPDDVKFTVNTTVPENLELSEKEKMAIRSVAESLALKDWDAPQLFEEFYDICKKHDMKNTEFFRAAYQVLLGKDRGPKLAPFIVTIGREHVAELFKQV